MSNPNAQQDAKTDRTIAVVIALSALLSVFAPTITRLFGLTPRVEILLYLFSLAGFIWSLVVTCKLWQKTRGQ